MKAVITVIGKDKVGIIHKVSGILAEILGNMLQHGIACVMAVGIVDLLEEVDIAYK